MKKVILFFAGLIIGISVPVYAIAPNFSDVDYKAYYADGLNFMTEIGVVKGYGDNTFKPENTITRAETVTILKRFYDYLLDSAPLTIQNVNFEEKSVPGTNAGEIDYNLTARFITSKPAKVTVSGGSKQVSDDDFQREHSIQLQFSIPKETLPRAFHITIKGVDEKGFEAVDQRDYTFMK